MRGLSGIFKVSQKFVADNSPAILTGIGVLGTLTTAFLTGKAAFKASELILDEEYGSRIQGDPRPLEPREKIELVWREFVPAAGVAVMTITCIIGATRIGNRRAAALAAAYGITERAFTEYKEKVIERIGPAKEQSVRDEIAQDRVRANPATTQVIITGNGEVLCYDAYTGRYFNSTMETIKKAQNLVNYRVNNDFYASLSDFYEAVGLPTTTMSDEVGWNANKLLEIRFSTTMSEDDRPCIHIEFAVEPIRGYSRVN